MIISCNKYAIAEDAQTDRAYTIQRLLEGKTNNLELQSCPYGVE